MSDEDLEGQVKAVMVAVAALAATMPQDKRNEFHTKMRQFGPAVSTAGYSRVNGEIIRLTR